MLIGVVTIWGDDVPVELIDVLYVSKQGTHLLRPYGKVAHIDDVSQIVLGGGGEKQ